MQPCDAGYPGKWPPWSAVPYLSSRCMNGIGALSYLIDRWNFFFSIIGKIPVGVGFLSVPLDTVETATNFSPLYRKASWSLRLTTTRGSPSAETLRHKYWLKNHRPQLYSRLKHILLRHCSGISGQGLGFGRFEGGGKGLSGYAEGERARHRQRKG